MRPETRRCTRALRCRNHRPVTNRSAKSELFGEIQCSPIQLRLGQASGNAVPVLLGCMLARSRRTPGMEGSTGARCSGTVSTSPVQKTLILRKRNWTVTC
jgi:hypothetical protein